MRFQVDEHGRAIDVRRHDLRITERADSHGIVVFDWTCNGCNFAFGFGYPTREICEAMSAHHAPKRPVFGPARRAIEIVRKAG